MAFCLRHIEMFLVLMLMSLVVQQTTATGKIEVNFISYSARCHEDFNNNACDPKFTFCLGRPGTAYVSSSICVYGMTGQSSHYQNQNYINFGWSIGGLSNPWILSTPRFYDTSVMLVVKIDDDDVFDDDHLETLSQTVQPTVAATKELAQWSQQTMSSQGYTIQFQIRLYCDPYYYTSSCDVYCMAQNTSTGHYMCQDGTGKKMCLPGWTGVNCNEDIDECQQGFCKSGNCTNLPGGVRCEYPEHYTDTTTTTVTTTHMPTLVSTAYIMDNTSVGLQTTQDFSTKQSEISVWVIALLAVGCLIVILLVVLLFCCIRRRSKKRQNNTSGVPHPVPPLSILSSFDAKAGLSAHTLDETKPPKRPPRIPKSSPTSQVPGLQAKPVKAEANHYSTLNDIASQNKYNEEKLYEDIDVKDAATAMSKC